MGEGTIAGKQPDSITREPLAYPGYISKDGWFDGEPETPHDYLTGFAFHFEGNKRVAYVELGPNLGFAICEAVAGGGKEGIRHVESCVESSLAEEIARRHLGKMTGITREPGSDGEHPSRQIEADAKAAGIKPTSRDTEHDMGQRVEGITREPGSRGSHAEPEVQEQGEHAGKRPTTMQPTDVVHITRGGDWFPTGWLRLNKGQPVQTPGKRGGVVIGYTSTGKPIYKPKFGDGHPTASYDDPHYRELVNEYDVHDHEDAANVHDRHARAAAGRAAEFHRGLAAGHRSTANSFHKSYGVITVGDLIRKGIGGTGGTCDVCGEGQCDCKPTFSGETDFEGGHQVD